MNEMYHQYIKFFDIKYDHIGMSAVMDQIALENQMCKEYTYIPSEDFIAKSFNDKIRCITIAIEMMEVGDE
jgi:hypothetical protein